jgi:hypothetical protein
VFDPPSNPTTEFLVGGDGTGGYPKNDRLRSSSPLML